MQGGEFGSVIEIVIAALGIIMIVLWLVLPFIVIGIKSRIDRLIELLTVNNEMALQVNRSLEKLASEVESSLKT